MGRYHRRERPKGRIRERGRKRPEGTEGNSVLRVEGLGLAQGSAAQSGTGQWMAGPGELGMRAQLLSAARSAALCRRLNIH